MPGMRLEQHRHRLRRSQKNPVPVRISLKEQLKIGETPSGGITLNFTMSMRSATDCEITLDCMQRTALLSNSALSSFQPLHFGQLATSRAAHRMAVVTVRTGNHKVLLGFHALLRGDVILFVVLSLSFIHAATVMPFPVQLSSTQALDALNSAKAMRAPTPFCPQSYEKQ